MATVPVGLTALPIGNVHQHLKEAARKKGITFGSAVEPGALENDGAYARLISDCCDSLTAENALKWNAVAARRGVLDFTQAERLASFAHTHAMQVYGHCLVWHEALPDWVSGVGSAKDLEAILKAHILSVVGHFRGRIAAWDVVNEAIERNDRRPDGLRNSLWLKTLGPNYLDLAFQMAHEADPHASLVFSDYGLEYDDEKWMLEKRGTLLECLHRLKTKGVPVHALGIQSHLIGNRRPAYGSRLRQFLHDVAALGLKIYITELDVDDHEVNGLPMQRDETVAVHYQAYLDCVLDEPAVTRVTTWGLSDKYSSKRDLMPRRDGQGVRPLPFDANFAIKAAGRAMEKAFSAAPSRGYRA